jgi:pyruvate,water dikinase
MIGGMALRITGLDEVDPEDTATFGGKGTGLARLRRLGAAVPDAFLVAATARPPREWADDERARVRAAAAALLGEGPVAVRSSAVGEDSARRSFAGLFETVLGVSDLDGVEEAAARCIASAAAERVRRYAGEGAGHPRRPRPPEPGRRRRGRRLLHEGSRGAATARS